VSQILLCARSFHTLNRAISFRRIQILLSLFGKKTPESQKVSPAAVEEGAEERREGGGEGEERR